MVSGTIGMAYRDLRIGVLATAVSVAGKVATELFDASIPTMGESEGKDGYNGVGCV